MVNRETMHTLHLNFVKILNFYGMQQKGKLIYLVYRKDILYYMIEHELIHSILNDRKLHSSYFPNSN